MSRILEELNQTASNLYKIGVIKETTMRDLDKIYIPEVHELNPLDIKEVRKKNKVSQAIFAKLLNTSSSTVRQWESGAKKPSGIAVKLLNVVSKEGIGILH
jgi:putative transcriptional regulator